MASPEGDTMKDDENTIRRNYQISPTDSLWASAPVITAFVLDTKWVVAVSAIAIIIKLSHLDQRLHDLCVRHRRTNLLMASRGESDDPSKTRADGPCRRPAFGCDRELM